MWCYRGWKVPSCILCIAGICRLLQIFKRQLSGLLSVSSKAFPLKVYLKSSIYDLPQVQQTKRATRGCCGAVISQVCDSNLRRGTLQEGKLSLLSERQGGEKKMTKHWGQGGKRAEEKFCWRKHKEQCPVMAWQQWGPGGTKKMWGDSGTDG